MSNKFYLESMLRMYDYIDREIDKQSLKSPKKFLENPKLLEDFIAKLPLDAFRIVIKKEEDTCNSIDYFEIWGDLKIGFNEVYYTARGGITTNPKKLGIKYYEKLAKNYLKAIDEKRNKQIKLSHSKIAVFLNCPSCFWLQFHEIIKIPTSPFPTLPSGMDRILKEHFDQHRSEGNHPEELDGIKGHLFQDTKKLAEWRNSFKGLRYEDTKHNAILVGAIDDLFVTDKGLHAPLDFKTRGYPLKPDTHEYYQDQMDIYSFLLDKNGMKPANFAILLFYHPKHINSHCTVEFQADTIKIPTNKSRGEKIFNDAVKCLLGKKPGPTLGCEWCDLFGGNAIDENGGNIIDEKFLKDLDRVGIKIKTETIK